MNDASTVPPRVVRGVAGDLLRIHAAVSRAIDAAVDRSGSYASEGFPDEEVRLGFERHIECLITALNSHHLTEDEVAFPIFEERLPEAPFERLSKEHGEMAAMLTRVKVTHESLEKADEPREHLEELAAELGRIRDLWRPHIAEEERWFDAETVGTALAAHEQERLAKLFAKHAQQNAQPSARMLPFVLFHLHPEERAIFEEGLPWFVKWALIPVAWRAQWEPMAPMFPYPPG